MSAEDVEEGRDQEENLEENQPEGILEVDEENVEEAAEAAEEEEVIAQVVIPPPTSQVQSFPLQISYHTSPAVVDIPESSFLWLYDKLYPPFC